MKTLKDYIQQVLAEGATPLSEGYQQVDLSDDQIRSLQYKIGDALELEGVTSIMPGTIEVNWVETDGKNMRVSCSFDRQNDQGQYVGGGTNVWFCRFRVGVNQIEDFEFVSTNESVSEETLEEGMWVIKSQDGVEKRFKKKDSPEALAWAASRQLKPVKPKVDRQAQKDAAIKVAGMALISADSWGEMDQTDIIAHKIVPAMVRAYNQNPDAYSDHFYQALKSATNRTWGSFDGVIKYLDLGAKAHGYRSFAAYAKEMESYTGDSLEEAAGGAFQMTDDELLDHLHPEHLQYLKSLKNSTNFDLDEPGNAEELDWARWDAMNRALKDFGWYDLEIDEWSPGDGPWTLKGTFDHEQYESVKETTEDQAYLDQREADYKADAGPAAEQGEYIHYGRKYQTYVFKTPEQANAFMSENSGWGMIGYDRLGKIHLAKMEDEGSELSEGQTRGRISINDGDITLDGKGVGSVNHSHKNGYHPAVKLVIGPTVVWFELDEKNLIDKIFAKVAEILRIPEQMIESEPKITKDQARDFKDDILAKDEDGNEYDKSYLDQLRRRAGMK